MQYVKWRNIMIINKLSWRYIRYNGSESEEWNSGRLKVMKRSCNFWVGCYWNLAVVLALVFNVCQFRNHWRYFFKCFSLGSSSLRADEIKLWLTPSAKQRRNPCFGLPAVYPDLSTRHDWPVKKGFGLFVVIANQVEGEFETHFR